MSKTRATLDAQDRRVKFGLVAITVTILLLISASYAWFVGNQNVSINPFEINIAASESLELSLNGYQWAAELTLTEKAILGIESEENLFVPDPDDEDPDRRLDTIMNAYAGNKNNWPEKGLVPISTNGQMDINASRMILFEKTSLITTSGGYRVVANRIKNNLRTEGGGSGGEWSTGSDNTIGGPAVETRDGGDLATAERYDIEKGYIAFDLFIKNYSGGQYFQGAGLEDEEAIYLTTESGADVQMAGQKSNNPSYLRVIDGFENGVRVAFAQIGRTTSFGMQNSEKEPDPETTPQYYDLVKQVQGLNCNSGHTYYNKTGDVYDKRLSISGNPNLIANYSNTTGNTDVGICRVDNIWEPNDKVHTREALAYYKTSCKERIANGTIGDNTFLKSAYNTGRNCTNFTNGMQIPTYVINDEINVGDNGTPDTDIYDGLNGYNKTIGENKQLIKYNYFTDTDKMMADDDRKAFMFLASNSITKVRVYIYLEGQDIDNYYHGGIPKESLDNKGQNYGPNGYQNSKIIMNFGFTKSRFDNY